MTIDLAISRDWPRGLQIDSILRGIISGYQDGNYTAAGFLVWFKREYIIRSFAADELLLQPAGSFCPLYKATKPCNYRPRVQIVSKGPRECVPWTLVSASSDKHFVPSWHIFAVWSAKVGRIRFTRAIIKVCTLWRSLNATFCKFPAALKNFHSCFKLPSFVRARKVCSSSYS